MMIRILLQQMKILCKIFIVPVLISLFVFCQISAGTQSPPNDNRLRILDINVWSGLDYKGFFNMGEYETPTIREKRYQALISQIKQINPDIIGIHEANKLPYYVKRLANDIGYEMFYHLGVGGVRLGPIGLPWNLREGDAILAKKYLNPHFVGRKQLSGGYVGEWASFNFSDATQVIAIQITYKNRPIYIFATHWHASPPAESLILEKTKILYKSGAISQKGLEDIQIKIKEGADWRMSESKKTLEFIQETAGQNYFILMGDFNSEPGSREINMLIKSDMIDTYKYANPDSSGFTWDPSTNLNIKTYYLNKPDSVKGSDAYSKLDNFYIKIPKRIDYIFIGPSSVINNNPVSLNSCRVVMKDIINGVHASDHYGVLAEIQINR
jgi:endonuclease/exonuclease/phosphatase family metal-dependent hydrolase